MTWEQPHWSGRPQPSAQPRQKLRPNVYARLARVSAAHAVIVVLLYAAVAVLCGGYAATYLQIDPDQRPRITLDETTVRLKAELDRQFPGIEQTFLGVTTQRGVLQKVDTRQVPLSAYLGAVGMPGVTAWYGLVKIIDPQPGQTITVSAASGAVGSAVGQLAKARGCRVVGLAGGAEKCAHVVDELGFDACIDYRRHPDLKSMSAALKAACPAGIDGHFENVGGLILDAVMLRANPFSRVAMCGMIAGYDGQPLPMANPALILVNRMKIEGFIVSEHMAVWPEALRELGAGVATGRLKYRESIAQGLEHAPEAFIGLLKGRNFGKQLVKLV